MIEIVAECRTSLRSGFYTVALMGTLAAIDIAAALGTESGTTKGSVFEAWVSEHLGAKYPRFQAADIYKLRCGTLHQGQLTAKDYEAVLFNLPNSAGNVLHDNVINRAYVLDLVTFCEDVLSTIEQWWREHAATEPVARNASALLRVRPEGLSPYIIGTPVLA